MKLILALLLFILLTGCGWDVKECYTLKPLDDPFDTHVTIAGVVDRKAGYVQYRLYIYPFGFGPSKLSLSDGTFNLIYEKTRCP